MKVKVLAFGALTEILDREFYAEAEDTATLWAKLRGAYPALTGRKLLVAVNSAVVTENVPLQENDVVALMPPYSGG